MVAPRSDPPPVSIFGHGDVRTWWSGGHYDGSSLRWRDSTWGGRLTCRFVTGATENHDPYHAPSLTLPVHTAEQSAGARESASLSNESAFFKDRSGGGQPIDRAPTLSRWPNLEGSPSPARQVKYTPS